MKAHFAAKTRRGTMLMETLIALGALLLGLMLVAEMGAFSIGERGRTSARQTAQQEAANTLEIARALPWEQLTPEWASSQKLSESAARLHEGNLTLKIEPEPKRPLTKRLTAIVTWKNGSRDEKVELTAFRSARTADAGGKP
jgi:hypothetical protein